MKKIKVMRGDPCLKVKVFLINLTNFEDPIFWDLVLEFNNYTLREIKQIV